MKFYKIIVSHLSLIAYYGVVSVLVAFSAIGCRSGSPQFEIPEPFAPILNEINSDTGSSTTAESAPPAPPPKQATPKKKKQSKATPLNLENYSSIIIQPVRTGPLFKNNKWRKLREDPALKKALDDFALYTSSSFRRAIRTQKEIPLAIVYGKGEETLSLQIELIELKPDASFCESNSAVSKATCQKMPLTKTGALQMTITLLDSLSGKQVAQVIRSGNGEAPETQFSKTLLHGAFKELIEGWAIELAHSIK